jgi:competence protein ComEA
VGDALGVDLRPRRLIAGLGVIAAVAVIAVGGFVLFRPRPAPAPEVSLPYADGAAPSPSAPSSGGGVTSTTEVTMVFVHAAGAVNAPGVYQVPSDARLADVVRAAGGATADADLDRVNLAAPVEDGQQLYVPRLGEATPPVPAGAGLGESSESPRPVDVNTADVGELESLPGVGPATAAAIVAYRDEHGPFATVDQLLEVPGIGEAKLAQLRDLVTV